MAEITTPVLLIIFNRPDKVRGLIDALTQVRPARIFISADGPRTHVPTDPARCAEARAIAQDISWPCEIRTNFSDTNLGIHPGVEKALNWFFDEVEEGIVLEDDCLPHRDFFLFTQAMLERYRENKRVMMISGDNFQDGIKRGDGDYYFSRYPNIWGWASWRRAWRSYDTGLSSLPAFIKEKKIRSITPDKREQRYWLHYFKKLYAGTYTSWDAKWVFAVWNNDGVAVIPNKNLIENIGFGEDATHTKEEGNSRVKTATLGSEFRAPESIKTDEAADAYLFRRMFYVTLCRRILNFIIRVIRI